MHRQRRNVQGTNRAAIHTPFPPAVHIQTPPGSRVRGLSRAKSDGIGVLWDIWLCANLPLTNIQGGRPQLSFMLRQDLLVLWGRT